MSPFVRRGDIINKVSHQLRLHLKFSLYRIPVYSGFGLSSFLLYNHVVFMKIRRVEFTYLGKPTALHTSFAALLSNSSSQIVPHVLL
jgi:hypothetical protein